MPKEKRTKQPQNGSRREQFAYRFADDAPAVHGYRHHGDKSRLVSLLMDGKRHKLEELERRFPNVDVRRHLYRIGRDGPYALDSSGHPRPWKLECREDTVRLLLTSAVNVNIEIINIPVSLADWKFAVQAAEVELPALTDEQKAFVRRLGISELDYARQVLARRYAEVRYRGYAEEFRRLLGKAASGLSVGSAYVIYDLREGTFSCRLTRDDSVTMLRLNADLVTVPLDQGDLTGLGQAEKAIERALAKAVWIPVQEVRRAK